MRSTLGCNKCGKHQVIWSAVCWRRRKMQQADMEKANITSSVGPRGVIKQVIVLTKIVWLSVSEAHSALLFTPTTWGYVLLLAISGSLMWGSIMFWLLDHLSTMRFFFVQQYSLMAQSGTVPLLPLSGCVLPDRGQAHWREVGWSSECHRTATWWGKEWILLCLWRSRCMYASLWSYFNLSFNDSHNMNHALS